MSVADRPVSNAEAEALFADLAAEQALVLAISGGPDSTALLYLMARWRAWRKSALHLIAVTIDHGLRPEARREAAAVKRLSEKLGVEHRTMRWGGAKPSTGLQQNARVARYRLLDAAARRAKASRVVTAHTLDDQAETILFRMARGSGLAGICGMAGMVPIAALVSADRRSGDPAGLGRSARTREGQGAGIRTWARHTGSSGVLVVRPLLDLTKARLIVTLEEAGITYVDDPSNADPRFARSRFRKIMPALATEGLTPHCLVRLAHRVRRSEAAIEAAVNGAALRLGLHPGTRKVVFESGDWGGIPAEIALRLLGRAVGTIGNEGDVELGKLEALIDALEVAMAGGGHRFRRTLAGAMVSLQKDRIIVEPAPPRRYRPHD